MRRNAGAFAARAASNAEVQLPPAPYLLRAHLQGYIPARGRIVQVSAAAPAVSSIALARGGSGPDEPRQVLAAGVGDAVGTSGTEAGVNDDDHSETAWHLRRL